MKRSLAATALMLILGPLAAAVVWAVLDATTTVVASVLPVSNQLGDAGPALPDSVLLLWAPALFVLNAIAVIPATWAAVRWLPRLKLPSLVTFALLLSATIALLLATDAPADGNRLETFGAAFYLFSTALLAMAGAGLLVIKRSEQHSA